MVIDVGNYEDNDGDDEGSTDVTIGPVRDADTGEIETPASETGDGSTPENNDGGGSGSTVVVPEDPGTRDRLKEETGSVAAGSGDTSQEARQDAAENQSFDADPGSDVGEIEREQDLNQPLKNPQGSTPEEVQEAAEQIAGSDRFRGGRTGRQAGELAQAIQRGQDQFDSVDIQQKNDKLRILGPEKNQRQNREQELEKTQTRKISAEELNNYTGIGTLINPNKGNPDATLAEEFTTAGVDLIKKGQNVGDSIGEAFPTREDAENFSLGIIGDVTKTANQRYGIGTEKNRQEFLDNAENFVDQVPETRKTSSLERGVARTADIIETGAEGYKQQGNISKDQIIDATTLTDQEKAQARENVISGIGTGGTAVTGLGISSLGAIPRASATTTQNALGVEEQNREIAQSSDTGLVEGSAQGFVLTGQQAAQNPDRFVGEEVGEEIGEAAVFGTLTGGAGLAVSAVPTPEFEVTPEVRSRASSARNTVQQMRQSDSTTSEAAGQLLTNNVNTDALVATTQQPDTDVGPGRTLGPGSRPNPETETDTLSGVQTDQDLLTGSGETTTELESEFIQETRSGAPSLEDSISSPQEASRPQSDVLDRPESDIVGEVQTRTETKAEPRSEPTVFGDVLAETKIETEPRLETRNELIPELNRRPEAEVERGNNGEENEDALAELVGTQEEFQFQSSVGAELLGIEAEKQPSQLSASNPLNLRPDIK